MSKYLVSTTETYRVDTESEATKAIEEAKQDGSYVLLNTRGFVLTDINGDPEYFGGIMYEV